MLDYNIKPFPPPMFRSHTIRPQAVRLADFQGLIPSPTSPSFLSAQAKTPWLHKPSVVACTILKLPHAHTKSPLPTLALNTVCSKPTTADATCNIHTGLGSSSVFASFLGTSIECCGALQDTAHFFPNPPCVRRPSKRQSRNVPAHLLHAPSTSPNRSTIPSLQS